eukprot:Plantae.Rhodophyta-Palmaria_palmata.ctg3272.p1 GENE.Plantae.Rhodophyta-Palmaria_palmata.ctg3272~~Plantae.Rhodophyta-Palmaria_palmata.ctg3272.p1  ORF type:complete len:257 (+),score=52.47 Plantae.Rhodophyta-Palmaria_palmata.ctg3272:95-772(+)
MLSIMAMLSSAQNCFLRPKESRKEASAARDIFVSPDGDHLTLLRVYREYLQSGSSDKWCYDNFINARSLKSAANIRNQLQKIALRQDIQLTSRHYQDKHYSSKIRQALLSGYFMQVAYKDNRAGQYLTVKDQQAVVLHPSCGVKHSPEWIMYNEFVVTKKQYIRDCSVIEGKWLIDQAEHYYDLSNFPAGKAELALRALYKSKKRKEEKEEARKKRRAEAGTSRA